MRAKPRPFRSTSTMPSSLPPDPRGGSRRARAPAGRRSSPWRGQGGIELGVVGRAQTQGPRRRIGDVGRAPFGRGLQLVQCPGRHVGLLSDSASARPARPAARTRRPGQRAGGFPVAVGDLPDTTWPCSRGPLQQPLAAGGQVVGHLRRLATHVVEVDDVEVGLHTLGHHAAVEQADRPGGVARQLFDHAAHRHATVRSVTAPVGEERRSGSWRRR